MKSNVDIPTEDVMVVMHDQCNIELCKYHDYN